VRETRKTPIHLVFIVLYAIAAILSLVPRAMASKACRLGYKAICSWSPYSTLILLAMLILHVVLHRAVSGKAQRPCKGVTI